MPERHLDATLVSRATEALLTLSGERRQEKSSDLFSGDAETVLLQFGLKAAPRSVSQKPFRIGVPHSFLGFGDGNPRICIVCKQDKIAELRALVKTRPELRVEKVLGLSNLRTEYKRFERRRELLAEFDLFLADERILPMMAKACGKLFFKAKKHPLPLRVQQKGEKILRDVELARNSTYLHLGQGPCLAVRVGHTGLTTDQIAENIMAVVPMAVTRIPKKWRNILAIHIKTATSLALPLYSSDRMLKVISRRVGDTPAETDAEVEDAAGNDAMDVPAEAEAAAAPSPAEPKARKPRTAKTVKGKTAKDKSRTRIGKKTAPEAKPAARRRSPRK